MGYRGKNLPPWMGEHKKAKTSSSMAKLPVKFGSLMWVFDRRRGVRSIWVCESGARCVLRSQARSIDGLEPECTLLISGAFKAILPSSDKLFAATVEPLFQRNGLLNVTKRRSLLRLNPSELLEEDLSPAKVKKWAIDDLKETIAWLESQEERGIQEMIKQWRFIPRVVKELARLEDMDRSKKSFHRKDLCRRAMICKRIYETEFNQAEDDSMTKKKKKGHGGHGRRSKNIGAKASVYAYDSDRNDGR
ncbi:hypothetical protein Scep_008274 [Stephania cephalantha]|uniref:Uncharacterized protein n=1 Tax=Stephania cephalantha TaxID=152367 RepID=A0AAP0KBN4_9MAGN